MARIVGTAGSAPRARKPRVKPKAKPYHLPKTFHTEAAAPKQPSRARVQHYTSSPHYRQQVRKTYTEQPLKTRRQQVAHIKATPKHKRSKVQREVLRKHAHRHLIYLGSVRLSKHQPPHLAKTIEKKTGLNLGPKYKYAPLKTNKSGLFGNKGPIAKIGNTASKIESLPAREVAGIAQATYHHPTSVPVKTAGQALKAAEGAIPGAVEFAIHPVKGAKKLGKSIVDAANESNKHRVKRIEKEGALSDIANATIVAAPEAALARAGLETATKAEFKRAKVRTSGGVAARRPSGPVRDVIGQATDKARGAKLKRELKRAEAGGKPMNAVRHQAAVANRKAGKTVEVPRRVAASQIQKRLVAKTLGRGHIAHKHELRQRVGRARKNIAKLNKDERRAFHYAAAFGIRTPKQARALLTKLRDEIHAHRKANELEVTGTLKRSDMIRDLEKILAAPEKHFTSNLAKVVEGLKPESHKAAHEDPRLTPEQAQRRRLAPQHALVATPEMKRLQQRVSGLKHELEKSDLTPEARRKFKAEAEQGERELRRLAAREVRKHGLAEPQYVRSERHTGVREFIDYALGGEKGAMRNDRRYTGKNLREGLQDTSPEIFLRGMARNIKAKHNFKRVTDIVAQHHLPELTGPAGDSIPNVLEKAAKQGVNPKSFGLFNPRVYRDELAKGAEHEPGAEHLGDNEEYQSQRALSKALVRPGKDAITGEYGRTSGWVAVPKSVLDELEDQARPSRALGRGLDILKSKASRQILLLSPPWLAYQVLGQGLQTLAATNGRVLNPANWLGAAKWWHKLSEEDKTHAASVLGLNMVGESHTPIHLGASSDNAIVNAYRAMKAHPIWHTGIAKGRGPSISQLNPMELMANADRVQNNAFRVLTAYTNMKPEAIKRATEKMGQRERLQAKAVGILRKPPQAKLRDVQKDAETFEELARNVDDFLGDYTTNTAFERRYLNRFVMFYPYLRFSLKLALYTLPVKHPVMTSLLAKVGQLHDDEIKKLLGDDSYWNLGKIYFKDGKASIDLNRANPTLNALADTVGHQNAEQIFGLLPPYAVAVLDQILHKSTFSGRDWRVLGKAAPYGAKTTDYKVPERLRIAAEAALKLSFPYREAEKRSPKMQGTQGDDSLLFSPRPVHFKGTTTASILSHIAAERRQNFDKQHASLLRDFVPFIPEPSRDKAAEADQRAIERVKNTRPSKSKSKNGPDLLPGFGGPTAKPKSTLDVLSPRDRAAVLKVRAKNSKGPKNLLPGF